MCCEDNSLLKDIVLSDPIENWGGSKRCCMSATKLRKLSDLDEKLTDGDYDKIGQEIGKLAPAKQVVRLHFRFSALKNSLVFSPDFVHKTNRYI